MYYYVVFVYLAAAKVRQRFDDLERLFEGFGPQGERNAYGGVDAFVDPEADVVPVFQIDGDVEQLWQSNIFGKPIYTIAQEGVEEKLSSLPTKAVGKLQETLQRVVNEGSGTLICIIL